MSAFLGLKMKYNYLIGLLTIPFLANANSNPSFSEVKIGFEAIHYSESLGEVAGLGRLEQSVSVMNPAIRQISYSGINENWGFYIESAATIATEIETETWGIGEFGDIQENAFKLKANEIGVKAAYNLSKAMQFTFGGKIYTSSFTRSNFKFVQPGANAFDKALIALADPSDDVVARFVLPGQGYDDRDSAQQNNPNYLVPVVSVSEDQMGVLLVAALRYDSHLADSFNKVSWYIDGELSTPMYSQTQNTQYETTTLTDSFNGYGVSAKAGVRYHVFDNMALMLGVDALYKERKAVTDTLDSGGRVRVPEIEYSNVAVTAGIHWSY